MTSLLFTILSTWDSHSLCSRVTVLCVSVLPCFPMWLPIILEALRGRGFRLLLSRSPASPNPSQESGHVC